MQRMQLSAVSLYDVIVYVVNVRFSVVIRFASFVHIFIYKIQIQLSSHIALESL